MTENEMKKRTRDFAVRVLKLVDGMSESRAARIVANQMGRSGTSVAANYRAACRARSAADMISKLSMVEEEADETALWLEIAGEAGVLHESRISDLHREAGELTAIMVASRRTLRRNNPKSKFENRNSP